VGEKMQKIQFLGEGGVGKRTLAFYFTKESYAEEIDPTLEENWINKAEQIEIIDNTRFRDCESGAELSWALQSDLMIYVFSLNSKASFEMLKDHLMPKVLQFRDKYRRDAAEDLVYIVVGNKCDLEEQRMVSKEDAKQLGGLFYIETSAKTGKNVREAILGLRYHRRIRNCRMAVLTFLMGTKKKCALSVFPKEVVILMAQYLYGTNCDPEWEAWPLTTKKEEKKNCLLQ
jgi:GTPase KRas protein